MSIPILGRAIRNEFGQNAIMTNGLKAIRERAKLTQAEAASLMGLSKSGYIKIEDGLRKLSDRHIRTAMRAFAATEREILSQSNDLPPLAPPNRRTFDLSQAQSQALARACIMFLEENADRELATQWLEALIEVVQSHGGDEESESLELLRAKVRTIAKLARAGLLT